jgi:hypothetical protein
MNKKYIFAFLLFLAVSCEAWAGRYDLMVRLSSTPERVTVYFMEREMPEEKVYEQLDRSLSRYSKETVNCLLYIHESVSIKDILRVSESLEKRNRVKVHIFIYSIRNNQRYKCSAQFGKIEIDPDGTILNEPWDRFPK